MSQHLTDPDSWIADHLAAPQQTFARFAERVYEGDALSRTTKELIAVATSTMLRCRHCTRPHIEAALEHGATKAGVAWVIGSGTQVVWHEDGFNEHLHDDPA